MVWIMTVAKVDNALGHYFADIQQAMRVIAETKTGRGNFFEPEWEAPELSEPLSSYFSASSISGGSMGEYRGRQLLFMDLTGNPRTHTTKTFGSQVIVARALRHVEVSGERVLLVTPSAANKAVALRDAVLRAYEAGVATPETLRVAAIVPYSSLVKIWDSPMAADVSLAAANPLGVFRGPEREDVKRLTTEAYHAVAGEIKAVTGFRTWYTLDPDNYKVADVVRASFERDHLCPGERTRWHSHAVSSAYGFLGHNLGTEILRAKENPAGNTPEISTATPAKYLLVQHLETPDLVMAVTGRQELPGYVLDEASGLLRQERPADPRFPEVCYSTDERLERTFYTRRPPTTPAVRELIGRQGGDGIVVSLPECLPRYPEVRAMVARAGMTRLPEDPRRLREWAMVMAVVGALTAIDRGLVPADAEVLVHGSGAYSEGEFESPDRSVLKSVATSSDVAEILWSAAKA